ncbi:unnamed protein product [Urochloa decumbens]|uniref:Uncharacterized protein n=1 Tax=Urochloa decumbens TaxID=240449 RepID=A0ABC8Y8K1_9POAL
MLDSVLPALGFFRLLLLQRESVAVRASNLTPKNTVAKGTGEASAVAPAQTAKVPTPFSF